MHRRSRALDFRHLCTVGLLGWAACQGASPDAADPEAAISPTTDPTGPTRLIFGRVHDYQDHNNGLPNARVSANGVEVLSDATGMFRLEAPTPLPAFQVDASAAGYAPLAVHLDDWGESQEFWPSMVPVDDVAMILGVLSNTSGIEPTQQGDQAYLLFQALTRDDVDGFPEGTEVTFLLDGAPAPDVYVMTWNAALSTCLPIRASGVPATTDIACDNVVIVPEVADGTQVTVDVEHSTRLCARSTEQRRLGQAYPSLSYEIQAIAGFLNATGVECVSPNRVPAERVPAERVPAERVPAEPAELR